MPKPSHHVDAPAELDAEHGLDRRRLLARTGVLAGTALITSVSAPAWAASGVDPHPDSLVPIPEPGGYEFYRTVGPATYDVVLVGAAGGGGQPGSPPLIAAGYGGASGAKLTARITVPAGTRLTIVRGGGGKAGTSDAGGAGGVAYLDGSGGVGGLGAGGGGALSGLYINGDPILLVGGGGGGSASDTEQEQVHGLGVANGGGRATTGPNDGEDGQDGVAGGGGGGGGTGGAGGVAPTDTGQGGYAFVAQGPVNGAVVTTHSLQMGFINQTPPGADGAGGTVSLTYV